MRKVTDSEIIGCRVRKAMRKVPGDARRAARGRRKSREEKGGGGTKGEVVVVALINKINNPVNIRLNLCSLQ